MIWLWSVDITVFMVNRYRRSKPGWSVISRGFDFKIYGICSKNTDFIFLKWPWTQYNGMREVLQGMRLNTWVSSWNHVAVITSESSGHIPGIPIQCMVLVLAHFCQNAGYREQKPPFIDAMGTQLLFSKPPAASKIPSVSYATIAAWKREKLEEGWSSTLLGQS